MDVLAAQIHLAVNHLPVVGALLASLVLAFAVATRRAGARNVGFGLLVFAGLSVLPAYFSGEGAEEVVEHRPGVSEALIETHEDAATRALAATLAAGAIAAAALLALALRRERALQGLSIAALIAALVSTVLIAQTAHLGGQIRHDELRPQGAASASPPGGEFPTSKNSAAPPPQAHMENGAAARGVALALLTTGVSNAARTERAAHRRHHNPEEINR